MPSFPIWAPHIPSEELRGHPTFPAPWVGCAGRKRSCPAGTGGTGVCRAAHTARARPLQAVRLGSPASLKAEDFSWFASSPQFELEKHRAGE